MKRPIYDNVNDTYSGIRNNGIDCNIRHLWMYKNVIIPMENNPYMASIPKKLQKLFANTA